jgi:hypothetical protein
VTPVHDAWRTLEIDPDGVFGRIASRPRAERADAAEVELEVARRRARELMIKYHPDRNQGDSAAEAKFKNIQAAIQLLVDSTQEFRRKLIEVLEEDARRKLDRQKNAVFIKIG